MIIDNTSDNIFENSTAAEAQPDALTQAESALWKYFGLDFSGSTPILVEMV